MTECMLSTLDPKAKQYEGTLLRLLWIVTCSSRQLARTIDRRRAAIDASIVRQLKQSGNLSVAELIQAVRQSCVSSEGAFEVRDR